MGKNNLTHTFFSVQDIEIVTAQGTEDLTTEVSEVQGMREYYCAPIRRAKI